MLGNAHLCSDDRDRAIPVPFPRPDSLISPVNRPSGASADRIVVFAVRTLPLTTPQHFPLDRPRWTQFRLETEKNRDKKKLVSDFNQGSIPIPIGIRALIPREVFSINISFVLLLLFGFMDSHEIH